MANQISDEALELAENYACAFEKYERTEDEGPELLFMEAGDKLYGYIANLEAKVRNLEAELEALKKPVPIMRSNSQPLHETFDAKKVFPDDSRVVLLQTVNGSIYRARWNKQAEEWEHINRERIPFSTVYRWRDKNVNINSR